MTRKKGNTKPPNSATSKRGSGGCRNPAHHNFSNTRFVGRVEYVSASSLNAYANNPRSHTKRQLKGLTRSILEFGFVIPIVVDKDDTIISGHARLQAAENAGIDEVPIIRLDYLTPAQVSAFRIADNKLAELGEWDAVKLAIELRELVEIDYDATLTGFEMPEIELLTDQQLDFTASDPMDHIPPVRMKAISQKGDLWLMDRHRLICADAQDPQFYSKVLEGRLAQSVITDPPYNVPIDRNVCGSGSIQHREFPMASGEMTDKEFANFLFDIVRNLVRFSEGGSVHFIFMDWRHLHMVTQICEALYDIQLNLCVWAKTNGGMGSLYRSQHELVLVFRNGDAPHINNVMLGKYKRNRTNVWNYAGVNTLDRDRRKDLALHPTVKPLSMVADAIRDCSHPSGVILDTFLGSGTTLLACEQTGRICAGIELDPLYVDVTIRRWQDYTGCKAIHAVTGQSFDELSEGNARRQLLLPPPEPVSNQGEV